MATRRRVSSRSSTRPRRSSRAFRFPRIALPAMSADISRSIIGIVLLVLGAVTLIALILPGQGRLTDWWRDFFAPYFGAGRFLLPFLLLGTYCVVASLSRAGTIGVAVMLAAWFWIAP